MNEKIKLESEEVLENVDKENLVGSEQDFVLRKGDLDTESSELVHLREELERDLDSNRTSGSDIVEEIKLPKNNKGLLGKMGRLGVLLAGLLGGNESFAQNQSSTNTLQKQPTVPTVTRGEWPGQKKTNSSGQTSAFSGSVGSGSVGSGSVNSGSVFPGQTFSGSTPSGGYRSGEYGHERGGLNLPDYLRMSEVDFIKFVFFSVLKKNNESPNNYNFEAVLKHCLLIKKGEKPQFPHPKMPRGFIEELSRLDREREAYKNGGATRSVNQGGSVGYSVGMDGGVSGGKASDQWRNPFKGGPKDWGNPDRK
jgi:hypothetical protein